MELKAFEKEINYNFSNIQLLKQHLHIPHMQMKEKQRATRN